MFRRYALTLRLMLASLRKHRAGPQGSTAHPVGSDASLQSVSTRATNVMTHFPPDPTVLSATDEFGMNWPAYINQSQINPAMMPAWLQEGVRLGLAHLQHTSSFMQNFTDLGLPPDGFEGVFFPGPISGWPTELEPMPEAW